MFKERTGENTCVPANVAAIICSMSRKILLRVAAALLMVMGLSSCVSMMAATDADKQRVYQATPEQLHAAIRAYMFDYNVMVVDEGDGYIRGEYENASLAAGTMTGGSVRSYMNFQYRPDGDVVLVRASLISEASGRRMDVPGQTYRDTFDLIAEYLETP